MMRSGFRDGSLRCRCRGCRGHRRLRRLRSRLDLLFCLGRLPEVLPDFIRNVIINCTGVRLLVRLAYFMKIVQDSLTLHFQLARQVINANFTAYQNMASKNFSDFPVDNSFAVLPPLTMIGGSQVKPAPNAHDIRHLIRLSLTTLIGRDLVAHILACCPTGVRGGLFLL
jgi:hypothetical protein